MAGSLLLACSPHRRFRTTRVDLVPPLKIDLLTLGGWVKFRGTSCPSGLARQPCVVLFVFERLLVWLLPRISCVRFLSNFARHTGEGCLPVRLSLSSSLTFLLCFLSGRGHRYDHISCLAWFPFGVQVLLDHFSPALLPFSPIYFKHNGATSSRLSQPYQQSSRGLTKFR